MPLDKKLAFLLIASLAIVSGKVTGQEEKTTPWFETISLNGFLSAGYSYNFNRPDTSKNFYRVFDSNDETFSTDVIELSLKKDPTKGGDAGFRFDLTAGTSIPRITRSSGFDIGDLDFHQVFLSYIAPLGSGLRLDAGKFITPAGYEVIEGYDGYNDNYSRSLLFGYAIPFTHTGVKASYTFTDHLSALMMVVNGWDDAIDNNTSKTLGAQLNVIPCSGMNVFATVLTGAEKPQNNFDKRNLYDVVTTYTADSVFIFGINGDYCTEQHSAIDGGTAVWDGIAGYVRWNIAKYFSLSMRGEQFEDLDGIRTGTAQILHEITLTPEYRAQGHLVLRGDLRIDRSDRNVFQKQSGWTNSQFTTSLNIIVSF